MNTTVLSMNEKDTLPDGIAEADLRRVLHEADPDLGGLQEWSTVRDRATSLVMLQTGRAWARGPHGGGPVFWRIGNHQERAVRSIRLSRGEFVGHLLGRRSRLGPSWATEAVLDDLPGKRPDGSQTVVLNAHLTAEVQVGAGYRKDLAHRLRVMRHKREKRRLGRRARAHKRRGRRVFVVLDGNFDGLELGGFVSCWEGHDGGSLGSRAVDIVFTTGRAVAVKTYKTHSDHRAVAATYR